MAQTPWINPDHLGSVPADPSRFLQQALGENRLAIRWVGRREGRGDFLSPSLLFYGLCPSADLTIATVSAWGPPAAGELGNNSAARAAPTAAPSLRTICERREKRSDFGVLAHADAPLPSLTYLEVADFKSLASAGSTTRPRDPPGQGILGGAAGSSEDCPPGGLSLAAASPVDATTEG